MYQVIKRDGQIAEFDIKKIALAITKAFDAVQKQYHSSVIDLLALKERLRDAFASATGVIPQPEIQGF